MRASRYNIVVANDDEHLLFNSANGAFAALDNAAYEQYKAGEGDQVAMLADAGFFTELTAEEELAAQQAAFDAQRVDPSRFIVSFVPTYACNYRCPYCYEIGHNDTKGKMDARTIETICDFIQGRFDATGFSTLSVQWYGGDPSLALDVVEDLSARLIAWCADRGVAYNAIMLSNANLIDEDAAKLIATCQVREVMLTIDGPEPIHNVRRVAANGTNSYERNIQAARYLRANGVKVFATMNVDKVNWPYYTELRDKLLAEEGITLTVGKLCDYGHFYGQAPFAAPDFDLFTHEEFAHERFKLFEAEPHTAAELAEMLRAPGRFCSGQIENYFVIDLLGNVYKCDGWVGDTEHVRFNLFDDPSTWKLSEVSHDATRDEKCSACKLLPICHGNCIWERECNGWPCHPFKYTIDGYLKVYRRCFGDAAGSVTVFTA